MDKKSKGILTHMASKKEYVKNITQYFRQSLIDGERTCPSDDEVFYTLKPNLRPETKTKIKGEMVALNVECWEDGCLTPNETELIFKKIDKKRKEKNKKPPDKVELVLYPRIELIKTDGGQRNTYKRKTFLPLVIFIKLDRGGGLSLSDKPPWIPRIWLSPNVGQDQPIGDLSAYDDFVSENPYEAVTSWEELKEYCNSLLEAVSGNSLRDESIHEEYVRANQAILLISPPIIGAKKKIESVLEKIIDGKKPGPHYNSFVRRKETSIVPMIDEKLWHETKYSHVGQMTDEFPLSTNQRNALHHFMCNQNEGEILAINGPPGTGKTTFLRTIVANCWVDAALSDKEPPIIVAVSNNNQAVTNILEDFSRVEEKEVDAPLRGRWIPDIDSYGLYCPARYLTTDECKYPYHGQNDEGLMLTLQTMDYLKEAETQYLELTSIWANKKITKISSTKKKLHDALTHTVAEIKRGLDSFDKYRDAKSTVFNVYSSEEKIGKAIVNLYESKKQAKKKRDNYKQLLDDFYQLLEDRPWWAVLFLWLPQVEKHNQRKNSRFLNLNNISVTNVDDDSIEVFIKQYIINADKEYNDIERRLKHIRKIYEDYKKTKLDFFNWFNLYKPAVLHTSAQAQQVDEICDRILRFKAFKLATHYWEAVWLIENRKFVESDDNDKKSPVKLKRKWRRFAKLTPCFVSTFYMVPTFFTAFERRDGNWEDIPLFNFIDLLIVDEAGQAVPDVSSASFALSKKSIIVGDVDQIEPVWNVPASIDKANLSTFNLLDGDTDYEDYWLTSGQLASAGNIMRIGQRQCQYHQFTQLSRGLYFTEHRRCYDSIIEYCNDLVYKGILELKRGEPKGDIPWPQMAFYHVDGGSQIFGKSRYNTAQVNLIIEWLVDNNERIVTYARENVKDGAVLSNENLFKKAVAVVTPFAYQAKLIRNALRKRSLPKITVGTVHKLQGAERLIILFSSVYGDGDQSIGKFYDRGHNMLNVAVSRAKDSFSTFGHRDVFGKGSRGTPSAKLMCRLVEVKTEIEEITLL